MQRFLLGVILLIFFLNPCITGSNAADAGSANYFEERYRNLSSKLDRLQESYELILKRQQELEERLDGLSREMAKVRDDNNKPTIQWATREELKALVEKMRELDRNREHDKKLLLDSIQELAKVPAVHAPAESRPANLDTYVYKVKPSEFLIDIIAAYNEKYKSQGLPTITMDQVKKANPGMNPNQIIAGQSIHIPIPSKKKP